MFSEEFPSHADCRLIILRLCNIAHLLFLVHYIMQHDTRCSSLSYAFSLFKLSEDKAAQVLAETATADPERTASNQKLLFFGNHILKSPEARAKLQPIRDMLTESYRDDVGISGDDILEKSQQ